jgi:hypothetical protein
MFALIASVVQAEESAHPGYPPTVLLASAADREGKVEIQLSRPGPVTPSVDERVKPGDRFETEWVPLRMVTLGETVEAYGIDGKRLESKAVLKALAKPQGVAVFMRNYANDPPNPAPFYAALFREGTILLVANPADLYNPEP